MKKVIFTTIVGASLLLGACGSDTTKVNENSENTAATTETEAKETEEVAAEETEAEEVVSEDVQEDDTVKATNVYTDKDLGITGEVGPLKYEISGIQLKIIEPKDQATADLFEVEIGDEIHAFTIQMAGENTTEDDVSFFLNQAIAVTNTKEQLDPDMILSEYIDGEFLGQVRHEGHNVYVLKNSKVDELKTIELRIQAPYDKDFNTIGDEISEKIEVNK
ncbi:hypothetical protein B0H99_101417 [Planomicrobium soli]|uniref:DUF4352 domain-containing protein n=1 Tax=Planomicrobium soli TaxID=1176648 RepID=A0A2P8H7I5_9BACL|nr:hypothetical protein [Planomicrobium soli]PSL42169.1 hypothetical protein B0H99_101417 [Planomicrobium soli]